jgi:hypothetical protein
MSESIYHYSTRTEARRLSWAAALAGAYVMVHSMDVISTPSEALEDCGRIVTFFQSAPFHLMSPRDDLARAGTDYVFGDPSVGYLAYAADLVGDVGLLIPPGGGGTFDLRWFDCENGSVVVVPGVVLSEGEHSAAKPDGFGADVALSILPATAASAEPSVRAATWTKIKNRYRE